MNLVRKLGWSAFVIALSVYIVTAAQEDCPTIVQQALATTATACEATGRNQACYGNIDLSVESQDGVANFEFTQPGDLVDVASVQSLTLSPLDQAQKIWGVALLKLQANLPDTLSGQNVTFLLFGDVEIQNAVPSNTEDTSVTASGVVTLSVTVTEIVAPLMSLAGNTETMPEILNQGTVATADGRDASGMMLHVFLADGRSGWVVSSMLSVEGDASTLSLLDIVAQSSGESAAPAPKLAPLQAFYFKTGLNDAPCEEAPDSGILIQTPEDGGKIELVMNDATVTLGSTAYVQAQAGGEMDISVIEGQGTVEAFGVTVTIPAGMHTLVPLDDDLRASGPPEDAQPYDGLNALPISVLPQAIKVAAPLEVTAEAVYAGNPVPGLWIFTQDIPVTGSGCPPMLAQAFANIGIGFRTEDIIMPEGEFSLQTLYEANNAEGTQGVTYSSSEPGIYSMDMPIEGGGVHYEFRVTSPTSIEGETTINTDGCVITVTFGMVPSG